MSQAPPPPLDPSFADAIFAELVKMDVQLDVDPLQYGPKRLNGKVALTRRLLSRCEVLFNEVSKQASRYRRNLRSQRLLLDLATKHLLANDPEVRAGRAVSERDALAAGKLGDEIRAVADCEHAVEDLDAIMAVIKAKRGDLRDIQGRLRDQMRLCQEEIGLGGRWGSKSPRGVELEPGQGFADGSDVDEVDDLIETIRSTVEIERHLPAEVDDSDNEAEVEEDIASAADEADEDDANTRLCEVCGEPQYHTPSGFTCANGHGGADAVSPTGEPLWDIPEEASQPARAEVLPASADSDDVSAFLGSELPAVESKPLSRREIEESEAALDIDSILGAFDSD